MAPVNTNFAQAAMRHWDASGTLADEGRTQDAAYLAGYVGECALKAAMVALGGAVDPKPYGHDLEALSGEALDCAAMFARGAGRYLELAAPLASLPWKPEQRYEENVKRPEGFLATFAQARDAGAALLFALALDGLLEEELA